MALLVTNLRSTGIELADSVDGSHKWIFQAPDMSSDYTMTWPVDDGTASQFMITDGSGVLTWSDPTFSDSTFRVQDNADATKQLAFEVGGITTSTTRTITVCDNNIYLGLPSGQTQIGASSAVKGVYGIGIGTETGTPDNGYGISIGYQAGYYNTQTTTTGSYNTAVGPGAMKYSNSGGSNTAIGVNAMTGSAVSYISGNFNTAVGPGALEALTSGGYNVCFGYQAGNTITTGSDNVIIGRISDCAADTSNGVAVGYGALCDTGDISIGTSAGSITTSGNNICIGTNTGNSMAPVGGTDALYNVCLGLDAGTALTVGSFNCYMGRNAGYLSTTSTSNTCIGDTAGDALVTAAGCTHIGAGADGSADVDYQTSVGFAAVVTALGGTCVGTYSGSGSYGTALGYSAKASTNDVSIGYFTGSALSNGNNICMGYQAGDAMSYVSGDNTNYNICVGYQSGTAITTGYKNTCVGYLAGDTITTGGFNVCLGNSTDVAVGGLYNTCVGSGANSTTGDNQIAIGRDATTSAATGIAIGYGATITAAEGIAIGYNANVDVNYGIAIGYTTGAGDSDISIGRGAGSTNGYLNNIAIGYNALNSLGYVAGTNASYNVCVGLDAGTAIITGERNTCVGSLAGDALTSGKNNVHVGEAADGAAASDYQVSVGSEAVTYGNYGVAMGYQSKADTNDVCIGWLAGSAVTNGENICIGKNAGNTMAYVSGDNTAYNVLIGMDAGTAITTGHRNVCVGSSAGDALTTGYQNTFVGGGTDGIAASIDAVAIGHLSIVSGNESVAVGANAEANVSSVIIGYNAGTNTGGNGCNVCVGHQTGALLAYTSEDQASHNTLVGHQAGDVMTSGYFNACFGSSAGGAITTGYSNVCAGYQAGDAILGGDNNVCVGISTDCAAAGRYNTCVGSGANSTTGDNQVAVGRDAQTTGAGGVAVGYDSGAAETGVAIGYNTNASATSCVAVGPSSTASSATCVAVGSSATASAADCVAIGASSSAIVAYSTAVGKGAYVNEGGGGGTAIGQGAHVDGTGGTAIGASANADAYGIAIGNFLSGTAQPVSVTGDGIGIGANATAGQCAIRNISGAPAAGGVAVLVNTSHILSTSTSSIRFKTNVETATAADTEFLYDLRVVSFDRKDGTTVHEIGLIAEEMNEVCPGLVIRDADGQIMTYNKHDLVPHMLYQLQVKNQQIIDLQTQMAALMSRVTALEQA